MSRKLFSLLLIVFGCCVSSASVIYEVPNGGSQQGYTVGGFIEVSDFGIVTAADILDYQIEITGGEFPIVFEYGVGLNRLAVPTRMHATDESLSFSYSDTENNQTAFAAIDEHDLITWGVNDVQQTYGYWSTHREPGEASTPRWVDVVRSQTPIVGINPVVTPEPSSLLLAGIGLLSLFRMRKS